MPNGTGNFRNFQISRKEAGQPQEVDRDFRNHFWKLSVPSDFEPEFPEILVEWSAPEMRGRHDGTTSRHDETTS